MECLPSQVANAIVNKIDIREVRLRADKPVYINCNGQWRYVVDGKLSQNSKNAYKTSQSEIDSTINSICDNSIYAYEHQLVEGYLTADGGVRVGVGGRVICHNGKVKCFSSYSSMCIRFPKHISNCSNCIDVSKPTSVLVIAPPAGGKTTFLRDLLVRYSQKLNCVCIDDRDEITECGGAEFIHCDVLSHCNKSTAIELAIRCLSPQIIVTDEIISAQFDSISYALSSGIAVCGSIHGNDLTVACDLYKSGVVFEKYVILGKIGENDNEVYSKSDIYKLL